MSVEKLKVNDLIQILIPPGSIFSGHHKSRVEDIGEDKILLALPFKEGQPIPMHVGDPVIFYKITSHGIYVYQSIIQERQSQPLPIITVERPKKIDKVQRRNFYRFPVFMKTVYAKQEDEKDPCDWTWKACTIKNISAGGLLVLVNDEFQKNDKLLIEVPLLQERLRLQAFVKRVFLERVERQAYYLLGLEFIEPSRMEQEKIIQFIFARQREMRSQGLQ
ncbi:flagellar brake protein [Heliorestis convoluta]|uniref:Type iv pilus assembly protein PilZ n=1 Tax=Heliorestis convoluta TaxID=356322 RepID=A0A5Q2MX74_9FIRM|nr:flagellar brake domain-containing protein [Heliorestis convoluta]QGG47254.1 type iv pilus assembly protein PilZ [Heliorestis convoluta]